MLTEGFSWYAENSDLLSSINQYRAQQNLSALTLNTGAACVAQQVANQYKGSPCSNTTGADTVSGQEPQLTQTVLTNCNLQIDNVKDGYIAPECVPTGTVSASATQVAYANITASPTYNGELNNSKYVSAGVGSVDSAWFILILATNTSTGDYVSQNLDPSGASIASICFTLTAILAYVASSLIVSWLGAFWEKNLIHLSKLGK